MAEEAEAQDRTRAGLLCPGAPGLWMLASGCEGCSGCRREWGPLGYL